MSKFKRSSFRIDDILSLKTQRGDSGEDSTEHAQKEVTSDEDFEIDVGAEFDDQSVVEDSLGTGEDTLDVGVEGVYDVTGRGSPVSGGIPSADDITRHVRKDRESCDNNVLGKSDCFPSIIRGNNASPKSPMHGFPFSSKLSTVHKLSCGQISPSDDKKTYPLMPRPTKLPNSLESLMKSPRPADYFLQLSGLTQKLGSQWPLFRSELFMGLPSGHFTQGVGIQGLGLSPTDQKTPCICGSPTCIERTEALHSDGKP